MPICLKRQMLTVALEGHKKQLWHHLGMRLVQEIAGHTPWDILIPASALKSPLFLQSSDNRTPWHRCPPSPLLSPSLPLNLPLFSLYYPIPLSISPLPLRELEEEGAGCFLFISGRGKLQLTRLESEPALREKGALLAAFCACVCRMVKGFCRRFLGVSAKTKGARWNFTLETVTVRQAPLSCVLSFQQSNNYCVGK